MAAAAVQDDKSKQPAARACPLGPRDNRAAGMESRACGPPHKFFLDRPYDYYWIVEYDVRFSGA
jgi:hypothetical protein